jgi:5-methylcytosine-specific restriction protein A
MPVRPPAFQSRRATVQRQPDRASASERGYTWAWSKASRLFIQANPLCAYCALVGRVGATALTDHLYPHRTYAVDFWDETYWVPSCSDCHNTFKQALELQGRAALDRLARQLGRPPLGGGGIKSLPPHPS